MEPLDNMDISSEDRRETGDFDQFNRKLIPLQRNSYLGQFVVWSESVRAFQVRACFIFPMVNEILRWRFNNKNGLQSM